MPYSLMLRKLLGRVGLVVAIIIAGQVMLIAMADAAHAKLKLIIASDAKDKAARKAEKNELSKAINKIIGSKIFLTKVYHLIKKRDRCPMVSIRIVYGDSTKHTKKSGSGGTFVPQWKDAKVKAGERILTGGTLIIDKKLLNKERPDYSHTDFLAEVIAHELWHAYEDCLDTVYHDENIARRVGEDVATELGFKTLDGTRPAPPKKKKTVKKSETTGTEQSLLIDPVPEADQPQFAMHLNTGASSQEVSYVGIGTVITPNGESFLSTLGGRIYGNIYGASGSFITGQNLGPLEDLTFYGSFERIASRAHAGAVQRPGAYNTAITYHDRASNGSTGLALGGAGLEAEQSLDYVAHNFYAGASAYQEIGGDGNGTKVELGLIAGVNYEMATQEFYGRLTNPTFPGITSNSFQKLSEHLIGPRLGGYIAIVSTGLSIQIGASVDLMHRETDLHSIQQNRCNICAAPEDSFDVAVNQSKSDWVHRVNADLGVAVNLNENISLGVTGRASFLSARAGVRNPANPAEKAPHLIENDSLDFNIKGVAKFKF